MSLNTDSHTAPAPYVNDPRLDMRLPVRSVVGIGVPRAAHVYSGMKRNMVPRVGFGQFRFVRKTAAGYMLASR